MTSIEHVLRSFNGDEKHSPIHLPPLTLAYIGDTIYDLYVRTYLINENDMSAHDLHIGSVRLVRASRQAKVAKCILPLLSETEHSIYKRGRNAHIGTIPKSASIMEYRAATGLEALIGYLYLSGEDERLNEFMGIALTIE